MKNKQNFCPEKMTLNLTNWNSSLEILIWLIYVANPPNTLIILFIDNQSGYFPDPMHRFTFVFLVLSLKFLGIVKRKVLVLDLDETLIHSHHDGVVRQTVRPGTPPDFVLKVVIDRHPVRFFVHKRPHVDFFLDIVSIYLITNDKL